MIPPSIGLTAMGFADDLHTAAEKLEDEYPRLAYALRAKHDLIVEGTVQVIRPGELCPACRTQVVVMDCDGCGHIL